MGTATMKKQAREKLHVTYREKKKNPIAKNFSKGVKEAQRKWCDVFQMLKE